MRGRRGSPAAPAGGPAPALDPQHVRGDSWSPRGSVSEKSYVECFAQAGDSRAVHLPEDIHA